MARIPVGKDDADGKFLFAIRDLYTDENPWIRYVETTGNDVTGDGSIANPWRTIGHAKSQLPQVRGGGLALIKVGVGVFAEKLQFNSELGQTIITGSWEEVYVGDSITAYTRYGANTVEKWTEFDIDDTVTSITWDDTLLDMWIEFNAVSGVMTRLKILEYDAGNKRLFCGGGFVPTALVGAPPQACTLVRIATKITSNSNATVTVNSVGDSLLDASISSYTYRSCGIYLHAIIFETSSAAANGVPLIVLDKARVSFGQVGFNSSVNTGYDFICKGSIGYVFSTELAPAINALIDSRVSVYYGGGSAYGGRGFGGKSDMRVYGGGAVNLNLIANFGDTVDAGNGISLHAGNIVNGLPCLFTGDLYTKGNVIVDEGRLMVYRRGTLGHYIRCDKDEGRGGVFDVSLCNSGPGGSISFRGAPGALAGRIQMTRKGLFDAPAPIDCGDVTGHVAAVPLVTFSNGAEGRVKKIIGGATGADACPAAAPLVLVEKDAKLVHEDLLSLFHAASGDNTPTIKVTGNSKLIGEGAGAAGLYIESGQLPAGDNGVVHCDPGSEILLAGNLTIKATGNSNGHDIACYEGKVRVGGDLDIQSTLTGVSKYTEEGEILVKGTTTCTKTGQGLHAEGAKSRIRLDGACVYTGASLAMPIHKITSMAKCTLGSTLTVPTADYGVNPIFDYDDCADVVWKTTLATGGANNQNSNGAAVGTRVKRGAQLVCNQNAAGPNGGAGDADIGILGVTAYPAATVSKNDIPDAPAGAQSTAQFAAIHCK